MQGNILEVEENTKVKFPKSIFHVKKLVILLPSAQTEKETMRRKVTSSMVRSISKITNHSRTKVRKLVLLLKILIIVKMKCCILL